MPQIDRDDGDDPRVRELLPEATERAPDQQAQFLRDACGSQLGLHREVHALLSVLDTATTSPSFHLGRRRQQSSVATTAIAGSLRSGYTAGEIGEL